MKNKILVFYILSLVYSNSYSTDKNGISDYYRLPLVEKIVYTYKINNQKDIYVMNTDGSGKAALINWPASDEWNPVLYPDGTKLAFFSNKLGTRQLWVSNSDGTNATQITNINSMHSGPEW